MHLQPALLSLDCLREIEALRSMEDLPMPDFSRRRSDGTHTRYDLPPSP